MKEKIKKIGESKYLLPIILGILTLVGIVAKVFPINLDCFLFILLILWTGVNLIVSFEKAMCVIMFMMAFTLIDFRVFVMPFYNLMYAITTVVFGVKYLIKVFKKDAKLHIFPLVMSIVLILYSLIYIKDVSYTAFIGNAVFIALIYVFYCYSKDVDKTKIAMNSIYGLVLNIVIAAFLALFSKFKPYIILDNRFAAFFGNPNPLQIFCVLGLAILIMFYFKRYINLFKLVPLAIVLLLAGLSTLSKAFLICLIILFAIFCILFIKRNKKQGLLFLGVFVVMFGIFCLIFFDKIQIILHRFTIKYDYDNIFDVILTGRPAIWKKYLSKWSSSAVSIIFGCGVFAPQVGWFDPHSIYIELLYEYGIVGCLLIATTIISYIVSTKGIKDRFSIYNLIPLFMFLVLGVEESLLSRRLLFILIVSLVVFNEPQTYGDSKGGSSMFSKLKFIKFKDLLSIFPMILVLIPALITKIFIRDFWLICEERNEARDNGYWLFKYIREKQPQQKVAYAINKKAPEYNKVKDLGKVINYGGISHWFWYFVADRNISSQKGGKPNNAICYLLEVVFKLRKNNRAFLQHGITINDVEFLYFKNTNMRLFTTTTYQEYEYIRSKFGYPDGYVQLLGMPRFDNLNNKGLKKNQILVMPTWRNWITRKVECEKYEGTTVFEQTGYYKAWSDFLNSKELDSWLKKNKKEIVFYPHRNMQMYIDYFKTDSKYITIASSGEYDIQTLLNESSILITDYSSVFFDFAYLEKPVVFYQFDEEKFRAGQYGEGYFDYHDNDLSLWTDTLDGVIKHLDDLILGTNEKKLDSKKVFKYIDTSNSKRNYLAIKALGKQKFKKVDTLTREKDGKDE